MLSDDVYKTKEIQIAVVTYMLKQPWHFTSYTFETLKQKPH
jgi:hypothetical protein